MKARIFIYTSLLLLSDFAFSHDGLSRQKKCGALNTVLQDYCFGDGGSEVSSTATCTNKWNTEPADYVYLGCYNEEKPWKGNRIVAPVEDKFPTVSGSYKSRTNAIEKCAKVASCLGYKVFVIQDGGWCATSENAHKVYGKYGSSNACAQDGEGAGGTNAVYMLL
ncbi:uncharacterized protein LOC120336329 [Styela clava]|uniref:uncharacterized protein LOC120336329 n=1 Tax=Styela clava TaxID=7725 RepID=UPI0019397A79|nr:uncharacterized protein LOC120336329 [Styela clava]XP_039259926.1 uncharacterized protein LOC120336329 [Styela clava]